MRHRRGMWQERGAERARGKRRCHKTWAAIKFMTEGRMFEAGLLGAYDTAKGPNLAHMAGFSRNVYFG